MFNAAQKREIRRLARDILLSESWDRLPWGDAWNGAYPLRPTAAQVGREARLLERKAARVISGGSLACEYTDTREHIRMASLESARTFSIYAFHRDA